NRNEENRDDSEEHRNVFQLSPNDHRPLRIGRVMDNRPEETTRAEREEKREREQPRIRKLMLVDERADDAERERDKCDDGKNHRQAGESTALKIFAFRRWRVVQWLVHFFGAS